MGATFKEVQELIDNPELESEGLLFKQALTRLRNGQYVIEGVPLDVAPAQLFRSDVPILTHLYVFRMVSDDPIHYAMCFTCFDGESLAIGDFKTLLDCINGFLTDTSDLPHPAQQVSPIIVEGVFVIHDPDPNDPTCGLEVIVAYPVGMSATAFRWALNGAITQAIRKGFAPDTE